jgi:hypothetical protein
VLAFPPENPVTIDIIELTGVGVLGFCGHVGDVDFIPMVLWRVLPDSFRCPIRDYRPATLDHRSSMKDS